MNHIKTTLGILLFLVVTLLISCKSSKDLVKESSIAIPENLSVAEDTNSIGQLTYAAYFKDPILVSLIDSALANNYDMLMAIQRIEIAKAGFKERKFAWLPSLNFLSGAGARKYSDFTMDGVGLYDQNLSPNVSGNQITPNPVPDMVVGFETSWEIDVWGKLKNLKKAALQKYLASEEGKKAFQSIMVSEIAQLYYKLISLDLELKIAKNNADLQTRVLELVKIQKQGGRANELAVKQVNAQLFNTLTFAEIIEQEIVETENLLNLLLGRFPQKIQRNEFLNSNELVANFSNGVPSNLLANRPDIRQNELFLLASNADAKAARAAFLPSINLSAFLGIQSFRSSVFLSLPGSIAYNVSAGLLQPVFNRNALKAQFKVRKAEQLIALYDYEKSIVTGVQEVVSQLNKIENYKKIVNLKKQEVDMLKEAVTISNDLFATGNATYIEVITTQRMVLDEEINYTRYQLEEINGAINLYKALGGGWK